MTTAGRYIVTSNSLTGTEYPEAIGNPASMRGVANSLPEMLANVRRQVRDGVDFIKLADSPYGQWQAFTNDEMKAISELAHSSPRRSRSMPGDQPRLAQRLMPAWTGSCTATS